MVKTYLFLAGAVFFEVAGTMLLPVSQNFTKVMPTVALQFFIFVHFILTFVANKFLLRLCMQHGVVLEFLLLRFLAIYFLNKL